MYNVRWRLEFQDELGRQKRADVLERDYSGSITEVEGAGFSPLTISLQNSGDEKYDTIKSTEISLSIYAGTNFEFEEISTATDKQFKIEVYEDNTLKHVGYVIPEIYTEPYTATPYPVTLRATSLGILNNIRYADDDGEFYTGVVPAMTVIRRCLDKLDLGLDIWDSVNTWETRMNKGISPLLQVDIDQAAYIVEDRGVVRPMHCIDVLEGVLKPFAVNFFQDYGRWVIIPIEQRASSRPVRIFNNSGALQNTIQRDPVESITWIDQDQQLQPRPIVREVESEYEHRTIPDLIRTGGFDTDFNDPDNPQFGGLPERWEYSNTSDFIGFSGTTDGTTLFAPLRNDDGGPGSLQMVVNPVRGGQNGRWIRGGAFIEYKGDEITPGDQEYILSLKFRYRVCAPGTTGPRGSQVADRKPFRQRIQVRIGNQYLGADGSMSTSPTDIEIEDLTTARSEEVYTTFGLLSDMTNAAGQIRVRIYRPEIEGVAPALENKGEDVDFAKYPFISLDYLPDGEEQPEFTTFIGERDVESFANAVQYPVIHGDGPTNLHDRSFLFNDSRTESWTRGDLTGSITEIAINEIFREYQQRSNVINGTQRCAGLFDRYFAEFGEAYTPISGTYDERMCFFNGQNIQIQAGDVHGTIREITDRPGGSTAGGSGGREVWNRWVERLLAIGILAEDIDREERTAILCELDNPIRRGLTYWVVNSNELSETDRWAGIYPFVPVLVDEQGNPVEDEEDDTVVRYGPGLISVPIESAFFSAPEGSMIVKAPGQDETEAGETEEDIDDIEIDVEEIDKRVADGEANLETLEQMLEELEEELDWLNDEALPELYGALDELNDVVLPALQDDLNNLEDDLDELNNVTLPNLQDELDDILPITEAKISDNAISAPKLQANSVIAGKIATDAVTANTIAANAITANKIQAGAVVAGKLAADSVAANNIQTNAVTANKILAGAITTGKIGADAVTANKIDVDDLTGNTAWIGALTAGIIDTGDLYARNATIRAQLSVGTSSVPGELYVVGQGRIVVDSGGLIQLNSNGQLVVGT